MVDSPLCTTTVAGAVQHPAAGEVHHSRSMVGAFSNVVGDTCLHHLDHHHNIEAAMEVPHLQEVAVTWAMIPIHHPAAVDHHHRLYVVDA